LLLRCVSLKQGLDLAHISLRPYFVFLVPLRVATTDHFDFLLLLERTAFNLGDRVVRRPGGLLLENRTVVVSLAL